MKNLIPDPRVNPRIKSARDGVNKMVIRSEGAVEYVMIGVSRRRTEAVWRGKKIEPVQVGGERPMIS
ncbi:hypothetical protein TNIN_354191 [Trichonephila inaurata madagascariensis]|uniref:Uncharacterized protein n=1 Tax=Trichonephila inaurata madagascariensis TaxID=2747483 RepID=A0A8X7C9I0_9ARAC|nr:hypothetical protein TNIN_354191 [Trichonephila inaurata madagascariensis]